MAAGRMPVVFVPHGGGPWPFVEIGFPTGDVNRLADYLRSVSAIPSSQPKALLVVSAHWEEPVPTVMTSEHPPILYDYYGFPPESYEISWPAPGAPALASRVQMLLEAAGIRSDADGQRGYDHGTFIPLKLPEGRRANRAIVVEAWTRSRRTPRDRSCAGAAAR